jgi:hypothetical protein
MRFVRLILLLVSISVVAPAGASSHSCLISQPSKAALDYILNDTNGDETRRREAVARLVLEQMPAHASTVVDAANVNAAVTQLVIAAFADLDLATSDINAEIDRRAAPMCTLISSSRHPSSSNADASQGTVADAISKKMKGATEAVTGNVDDSKKPAEKIKEILAGKEDRQELYYRLLRAHDVLLTCKRTVASAPVGVTCDDTEIQKTIDEHCQHKRDNLDARCSREIFRKLTNAYAAVAEAADQAEVLDATSGDTKLLRELEKNLAGAHADVVGVEARRSASYGIYIGPSMALKDGGDWKSGSEFLFRAQTEAFDSANRFCLGPATWCRGYYEISYTDPERAIPAETPAAELPFDPFKDSKGVVRARAGLYTHINEWSGIETAVGMTSPVLDGLSFNRLEPHVRVGAHFQTPYNDGAVGEVSFGYEHDRSAQRFVPAVVTDGQTTTPAATYESFNRFYFDGTLMFPNLQLGGWRLAARLAADAPLNGNEEADVRASILLYYPFSQWLDRYTPKHSKPK